LFGVRRLDVVALFTLRHANRRNRVFTQEKWLTTRPKSRRLAMIMAHAIFVGECPCIRRIQGRATS
jgi:hypothetical protein